MSMLNGGRVSILTAELFLRLRKLRTNQPLLDEYLSCPSDFHEGARLICWARWDVVICGMYNVRIA